MRFARSVPVVLAVALVPAAALAQSTITGTAACGPTMGPVGRMSLPSATKTPCRMGDRNGLLVA